MIIAILSNYKFSMILNPLFRVTINLKANLISLKTKILESIEK